MNRSNQIAQYEAESQRLREQVQQQQRQQLEFDKRINLFVQRAVEINNELLVDLIKDIKGMKG